MGHVKRSRLLAAGGVPLLTAAAAVSSAVAPSAAVSAKVPNVPVAPADTIGFHGSGGILTDVGSVGPGRSVTISLEAETGGLVLDSAVTLLGCVFRRLDRVRWAA
jgi:hypothetical protein